MRDVLIGGGVGELGFIRDSFVVATRKIVFMVCDNFRCVPPKSKSAHLKQFYYLSWQQSTFVIEVGYNCCCWIR